MRARPGLSELGLGPGKKARLHRILNEHGLGNGTAIFLPYDQGLEHGPRDFFANPAASDPTYIIAVLKRMCRMKGYPLQETAEGD